MRTFPNLTLFRFLKWIIFYRQKFIRPFWYIEYSKKNARAELKAKTGWKYYGGHHLENRVGVFGHVYYLPKKFGIDYRFLTLAASVRSKEITRKEALKEYRMKPKSNLEIVEFVKKRLELSDIEFDNIMKLPIKSARDYPTYKRIFEFLRPLFFVLAKQNLVPMSFYLKYCFPFEDKS